MAERSTAATKTCRRCGRQGHAAFRLVDRLPSGTVVWECSVSGACGRKRVQLLGAPSGRGRSPSTGAARSALPPTVTLVTDDQELRDLMARTIGRSRMASLRTMTLGQATRSVTWLVGRPPDVLVIDAQDLGMAARNALGRIVRAAAAARCQVIVSTDDGDQHEIWADAAAPGPVLIADGDEAVLHARMADAVASALTGSAGLGSRTSA
jgi:hypothetical protein